MANEVGSIYVSVMPTTAGLTRQMNAGLVGAFDSAQRSGTASFGRFFARIAVAGASLLAAVGLGRLVSDTIGLGVAYNTLEQSSKAAFETLLGTAEAAKDMQQSIRDFAMTSPFPRQAFIKGSQQLLAFGFQAQEIIPTLDAVQDAVAAAGGGSQQLEEIIFVMAQIRAAGKITGIDLIQFGQRGINAAQLIGSQMGMTGEQIRESITAGTLDADTALEALTNGMAAKFGGASDKLKNTFVGAVDSMKAATRDLSSALVTPFVDPNGGGYAVVWANKLAGFLREVEKSPAFDAFVERLTGFAAGMDAIVDALIASAEVLLGGGSFTDALNMFDSLTVDSASLTLFLDFLAGVAQFLPQVQEVLQKLGPELLDALIEVAPTLAPLLPLLAQAAIDILPPLVDAFVDLVPLLVVLLEEIIPALIPQIQIVAGQFQFLAAILSLLFSGTTDFNTAIFSLMGTLLGIPGPISAMSQGVLNSLLSIFNGIANFINGIISSIEDLINALLSIGNMSIGLPRISTVESVDFGGGAGRDSAVIPKLAASGTVLPRPGGTLILAAEAGRAESVVDTGKLNDLMSAASAGGLSGGEPFVIENHLYLDGKELFRWFMDENNRRR